MMCTTCKGTGRLDLAAQLAETDCSRCKELLFEYQSILLATIQHLKICIKTAPNHNRCMGSSNLMESDFVIHEDVRQLSNVIPMYYPHQFSSRQHAHIDPEIDNIISAILELNQTPTEEVHVELGNGDANKTKGTASGDQTDCQAVEGSINYTNILSNNVTGSSAWEFDDSMASSSETCCPQGMDTDSNNCAQEESISSTTSTSAEVVNQQGENAYSSDSSELSYAVKETASEEVNVETGKNLKSSSSRIVLQEKDDVKFCNRVKVRAKRKKEKSGPKSQDSLFGSKYPFHHKSAQINYESMSKRELIVVLKRLDSLDYVDKASNSKNEIVFKDSKSSNLKEWRNEDAIVESEVSTPNREYLKTYSGKRNACVVNFKLARRNIVQPEVQVLIRQVQCKICGLNFISNHHYRAHAKAEHQFNGLLKIEGNFQCQKCPFSFSSLKLKQDHVTNVHNECFVCGINFMCQKDLRSHEIQKSHIIKMKSRSKCRVCHKVFKTGSLMANHTQRRHGNCRYFLTCTKCDLNFTSERAYFHHKSYLH